MEKNTMNKKTILIIVGIVLVVIAVGVWLSSQEEQISCHNNLDCPTQMKCEDSTCVSVGCVEEGGMIPGAIFPESRERMATECCAGLERIGYFKNYDADCNPAPLEGGPAGVCSNCGDGICEEWESKCNCPEDCSQVDCPSFMPPAPGWCEDGERITGGLDKNGCQMPPTCEYADEASYAEGELIVGFNDGVTEDEAKNIIVSYGLSIKEFHNAVSVWAVVNVPAGEEQNWIDVLENDIVIDYAELNQIVNIHNY